MRRTPLSIPEIALIGGTRAALGAGAALLLADRLNTDQRKAVGWTLFAIGAITTIPIAIQLLRSQADEDKAEGHPPTHAPGRLEQPDYVPG